jgi:hypothetical protein
MVRRRFVKKKTTELTERDAVVQSILDLSSPHQSAHTLSVAGPLEKQSSIVRRLTCSTQTSAIMLVVKVRYRSPIDDQVDLGEKLRFYLSIGCGKVCKGWVLGYFYSLRIAIVN